LGTGESSKFAWRDRAALHAEVWAATAADPEQGLGSPYDFVSRSPVGYTVFNSTDSATNCKVLVSQVDLADFDATDDTDPEENRTCTGQEAEFSNTIDLFDHLGAQCSANMTWATATLLSARFPFVSPSGRIPAGAVEPGCSSQWDMQLLDGGILDNSALSTTNDIMIELGAMIREQNATRGEGPLVVPVVIFVSNEPGADVATDASRTRPEIYAPIAAMRGAEGVQSSPSALLTRLSGVVDDVCVDDEDCAAAMEGVRDLLPGGLVVVSPSTTPSISVPLGWTLSDFSRSRLRVEADNQRLCGRDSDFVDHEYDYTDAAASLSPDSAECRSSGEYGRYGVFLNLFDEAEAP
jgi:hypothetical protein